MAIAARKLSFIKLAYQQIATILPNRTMNAAKRNLNPVFTTIASLSKTSKKRYTTELSKAFWEAIDNGRKPHVK